MRSRTWLGLCLVMVLGSTTAAAAAPPAKARATNRPNAVAPVGVAKRPAAKGKPTADAKPTTKIKGGEGPRRLEDIHIEGEIPVPQVLFITARDQRRFLDFQHRRYLRTSQQVGEQTVLPSWIGVTGNHPTDARKENPR